MKSRHRFNKSKLQQNDNALMVLVIFVILLNASNISEITLV